MCIRDRFNGSATGFARLTGTGSVVGTYSASASGTSFEPAFGNASATFTAHATGAITKIGTGSLSADTQLRAVGTAFEPAYGAIYATFSANGIGQVFTHSEPGEVAGDFLTASLRGKWKTGNVEGDFTTAGLHGNVKILVESPY